MKIDTTYHVLHLSVFLRGKKSKGEILKSQPKTNTIGDGEMLDYEMTLTQNPTETAITVTYINRCGYTIGKRKKRERGKGILEKQQHSEKNCSRMKK